MPTTAAGGPATAHARHARGQSAAGWLARLPRRAGHAPALARQHWLFAALLTAGLVLRVLAQLAYRPALLYIDSGKYLLGTYPGDDPPGYQFAIKPILALGNLGLVAVAQHLLGLAMAVAIYAVLLRRGAPRWLSALATAPVLLDGYQLQIEQNIMPDVMFEALIVAGIAALLWFRAPPLWCTFVAGFALAASATARQVGEAFLVPAVGYLLIAVPGWRQRLQQIAVVCVAFALPIVVASYKYYVSLHHFSLAPYASGSIYGRLAEAANCAALKVPSYERELCPNPGQKRLGPDGLNHSASSPNRGLTATGLSAFDRRVLRQNARVLQQLCPSTTRTICGSVTSNFDHRVLAQQPLNVVASVGKDALKLFAPTRVSEPGDTPITRWQFQAFYPQYPPYVVIRDGTLFFGAYDHQGREYLAGTGNQFGGGGPAVTGPLATFLRAYQLGGGYTPGPLFLVAVLAGLAGSLATLRRRAAPAERAAALGCLLFFATGGFALLSSDVFEFSWRYQLPALITLPPAAALALTILLVRRRIAVAGGPGSATGGEVIPDPLEAGHRGDDDDAERHQDQQRQPATGRLHDKARRGRAGDDRGQDPHAPGRPIRLAAGYQPRDQGREGAGQVGG
jgi:hypothetical protein